jgi:hypothetical protein
MQRGVSPWPEPYGLASTPLELAEPVAVAHEQGRPAAGTEVARQVEVLLGHLRRARRGGEDLDRGTVEPESLRCLRHGSAVGETAAGPEEGPVHGPQDVRDAPRVGRGHPDHGGSSVT